MWSQTRKCLGSLASPDTGRSKVRKPETGQGTSPLTPNVFDLATNNLDFHVRRRPSILSEFLPGTLLGVRFQERTEIVTRLISGFPGAAARIV